MLHRLLDRCIALQHLAQCSLDRRMSFSSCGLLLLRHRADCRRIGHESRLIDTATQLMTLERPTIETIITITAWLARFR